MNLPEEFLQRMEALLGEEYPAFLESYEKERSQGLRANLLKLSPQALSQKVGFPLEPVEWAFEGFRYPASARPGKHPFHEAGLYYIQEPSAMSAAALLDPQPGEWVLDLCAAPGGKSTQLATRMGGQGLLVSNEIHPARSKILSQNIERMGIPNALVTNETPDKLAQRWPEAFDRVLVDAPCSGEGMFRKDLEARAQWSVSHVGMCADRQLRILKNGGAMVRPGGRMVYSTCTFSPEENEGVINRFLRECPEFSVERVEACPLFSTGRPEWVENPSPSLRDTFRLWPHKLDGEGHYVAVLRKEGDCPRQSFPLEPPVKESLLKDFFQFEEDALTNPLERRFLLFGDQLYQMPKNLPDLKGLRVLRPGLQLGTLKKGRFEPAHGLALALKKEDARLWVDLPADSGEILAYLRGEALSRGGEKGWVLVTVEGFPIGWGKQSGGQLKNHYPKGLRWQG